MERKHNNPNFDDTKQRSKDEWLHLMDRQVLIFTAGNCSVVLSSIETEILIYLLGHKREGFPEKDYKIRWLQTSKNISMFNKEATIGDKAVFYLDYSGFIMI